MFVFIDEISFVGLFLLYRIEKQLRKLKGSEKPYGGMIIVFSGDFN